MTKQFLMLAGIALASACSPGTEERRAPASEDMLTRPLEVARVDTSRPIAPVEHQVTPPAEPKPKPAARKARRSPAKAPAAAAAPAPEQDTATVQGYAPTSMPDSAPSDTAVPPATDNAVRPDADTVSDTVAAAIDSAARAALADTTVSVPDTVAAPAADTTSTAVANDSAAHETAPALVTSPSAASTAAARTLPIGTEIHAALDDSINSRTDTVGRAVTAVIMENVTGSDGKTLIAAGAPVHFTVTRLSPARSKSAQGRLRLQVEGVGVGGEIRKISADVQTVPHELRGRGVTAGDAAKVGVGAAGGAVLGKVIGKDTKGAVIGGVIGAAGGAVVASQTATRDVVVKAKTPVVFVLTQPLVAQ